jgi:hypothetical protein
MSLATKLKHGLEKALEDPRQAAAALREVNLEQVESTAEAELVVKVLALFPLPPEVEAEWTGVGSLLHDLVAWFQNAADADIRAVFKRGAPELVRVFDATLARWAPPASDGAPEEAEGSWQLKSDLMFVLKVIALYAPPGGLQRLEAAARQPALQDEYLWSVILGLAAQEGHPWQKELLEALREPVPAGFAGVAYLDFANTVSRQGGASRHPFDTPRGHALLEGWLSDEDEEHFSYAHSAAASLPFVREPARASLLARAEKHPDQGVRLEAAWAAAKCGLERGLDTLRAACADPRSATIALHYLHELQAEAGDRDLSIPELSEDFLAMAEMCQWLAHPQEFGRPPRSIVQADARELFWPPTNDRRKLWLFRYEYATDEEETEPDTGYGMVGSVTFALFGETTADRKPEEVYALHCAWELEMNQDPRAPAARSVDTGLEILARHNPELKLFLPN